MKSLLSLIIAVFFSTGIFAQASFEEKVTSACNIGMTISNLGIIGNSFGGSFDIEGFPSCEYPVGSGIEHLFDGGLWVGGLLNGNTVAVSTGAVDASTGYSTGRAGFEFSAPIGGGLDERSSLFDSPFFTSDAISHQDFVSEFSDTAIIVPGTNIPILQHDNPMGINVEFEAYNWNFSFANFFVILRFKITNVGNNMIDDFHIGYWMDGVVRNVNITPPGGTPFFNKGGNGYIDSLYMCYEFDANGDTNFTRSYIATKFLGAEDNLGNYYHPDVDSSFKVHYNTWQFSNTTDPLYFFPNTDNAKFSKMNQGLNQRSDWESAIVPNIRTPNNRSNLVSAGNFGVLMPGQTIDAAFAIVCARKREGDGFGLQADTDFHRSFLMQNASWAQTAYNGEDANANGVLDDGEDQDKNGRITRYILPAPPDIPNVKIVPSDNTIDVYWTKNSEASVDPISNEQDFEGFRLYKTQVGFDVTDVQDIASSLKLVGEWDASGNQLFFDTGFGDIALSQPVTFEGDTTRYWYRYTFDKVQNGWQHALSVTAFDRGDEVNNLESLESSPLPNLSRVFPGKPDNEGFVNGDPFVYPNPYYAGASWEGSSSFEEDRKIMFANLPKHCKVRIYTVAGDLVDVFEHDENYTGSDIRWYDTYSDTTKTQFSGGEHAWDLLSRDNQIIARGIYVFSVEDLDGGEIRKGKFVVIK